MEGDIAPTTSRAKSIPKKSVFKVYKSRTVDPSSRETTFVPISISPTKSDRSSSRRSSVNDKQRKPPDYDKKQPIDDDQETVLDLRVSIIPYDETGRRTYEKACKKLGVVPSSNVIRKLGSSSELDVKHYNLGQERTMAIAIALVVNSSVTSLNLSGNDIGKMGVLYVQRMMTENMSITEMNLSDNNLRTFGAKAIGLMLMDNKVIKKLNISGNHFTDLDAEYLTKRIVENANLKKFNISWNGFDDDGGVAFGDAIAGNNVLTDLNISCTRIGPVGFTAVMKAFKQNEVLEVLRIGKNNIPLEAAEAALELLKELSGIKLRLLDMGDVMLGEEFKEKISDLQLFHEKLKVTYGYTDSYGKRKMAGFTDVGEDALMTIKEFVEDRKMTISELFARFDEDGSNSVDYDEFRQGIKEAGIRLSEYQVDKLIKFIDIDGDGDIDFSELVLKMKEITKKRQEEEEQRKAEAEED
ncbi:hypothetical protein KUTeg_016168 [Tegillarca granosa]|uniref:EF-hand domain-containing protein n=1 Tax=Tegillarca granosa TaxID=220873 RepID=A0ABQ9EQS4_TEGGR|nr:hypothetical protein KUTeg_016168 [Tegillarca granosa]